MGRRISTLALSLAGLLAIGVQLLPAAAADTVAASTASNEVGRVIVRFKAGADSVKARTMTRGMTRSQVLDVAQTRATALGMRRGLAGAGARMRVGRSLDERTHVMMVSGISSEALVAKLASDSEVEFVSVDQRRRHTSVQQPNDPLYGDVTPALVTNTGAGGIPNRVIDQWYLKAPANDVTSSINAPAAWATTRGDSSVLVAVLDTGVRKDHPDLAGQFIGGYDMISTAGVAGDGDGRDADATDTGDFVDQNTVNTVSGCTASDIANSSWHGTRVSGLIAALTDNQISMAGLASGVKILPVRVLGKCGGFDSDIQAGMLWAAQIHVPGVPDNPNKAAVINMSLGGTGSCSAAYASTVSQVLAAGVSIVAAAGNNSTGGIAVGVPANCAGVIAVGALRHVGTKVGFADLGPEVSISAPGGNCINTGTNQPCLYPMISLTNAGTTTAVPNSGADTGSSASVGTSFSAPLVSGTVALMKSVNPNLTPAQILSTLKRTSRSFVTSGGTAGIANCSAPNSASPQDECYCTTSTCGAGMLDAGLALAAAQSAGTGTVTVTATPTSVTAGQTVALTEVTSGLASNVTAASTAWSVVSGPGTVSGTTLTTTGAGSVVVQATVTDSLGYTHVGQATVTVTAAATTTAASSGGGGGGATSPMWLALLALACVALNRRRPAAG